MGFYEAGHWCVTTLDDAIGKYGGLDPADANPEDWVWAVYDGRYDDEPIANGMTYLNARQVATALNLLDSVMPLVVPYSKLPELAEVCECGHAEGDHTVQHGCTFPNLVDGLSGVCSCAGFLPSAHAYQPRRDRYDQVESKGYYVACCRACDQGDPTPIPFKTATARSDWIAAHTAVPGHTRFVVIDPVRGQDSDQLPLGFAQTGEVSFGEIVSSGPVTGSGLQAGVIRGPARLIPLDDRGRPDTSRAIQIPEAKIE